MKPGALLALFVGIALVIMVAIADGPEDDRFESREDPGDREPVEMTSRDPRWFRTISRLAHNPRLPDNQARKDAADRMILALERRLQLEPGKGEIHLNLAAWHVCRRPPRPDLALKHRNLARTGRMGIPPELDNAIGSCEIPEEAFLD